MQRNILTRKNEVYIISFIKGNGSGVIVMNKHRLYYEMGIRNVTVTELCEAIGMSRSSFYRKVNQYTEFTQGEIQAILDYLHLDTAMGIFFDHEVSQKETKGA